MDLQAGTATDASGALHLRGGRAGEVAYYVDGQRVEDPITGASAMYVPREAVEEISLLSGTFNAEYGDAMSGIVQVITKEGGKEFHGSAEYLSPMVNYSPYRHTDWARSGSDAVRDSSGNSLYSPNSVVDQASNFQRLMGRWNLSLNGPIRPLPNTTFFVTSVVQNENGYLPFGYDQNRGVQGKLAWSGNGGDKLTLSGGYNWQDFQNYNHAWKYVPNHYHKHFIRDQRLDLRWTHPLNRNAFFNVYAGYHRLGHDIKIFENWQDYLNAGYQKADFTFAQYFYDQGDWSSTWPGKSHQHLLPWAPMDLISTGNITC